MSKVKVVVDTPAPQTTTRPRVWKDTQDYSLEWRIADGRLEYRRGWSGGWLPSRRIGMNAEIINGALAIPARYSAERAAGLFDLFKNPNETVSEPAREPTVTITMPMAHAKRVMHYLRVTGDVYDALRNAHIKEYFTA